MQSRSLQTLYAYWNELRAGRLAPRRLEVEPSRIAGILAETFMLERTGVAAFQFRLAGTRLCELFGSELRGTNFLHGWSSDDREVLERALAGICGQGSIAVLDIEASDGAEHRVELEAILLPLLHGNNNTIGRIIGAMSVVTTPHWLGSDRLSSRRLLRHQVIWPDGRPHAVVEKAGLQYPFKPAVPEARPAKSDRPHLRLVKGGRTLPKRDDR